jgi:hypothetical protein
MARGVCPVHDNCGTKRGEVFGFGDVCTHHLSDCVFPTDILNVEWNRHIMPQAEISPPGLPGHSSHFSNCINLDHKDVIMENK